MILNEPAAQKEAFNLASLLTNVNPYNLIKPKVANGCLLSIVMVNDLAKLSLNLSKPDIHALKKSLPLCGNTVYGYKAPHKTGAGIGVLKILKATYDAPSVFFYVVGLTHPFFGRWCIIQRLCQSMVAQAGASSEAPVSFRAGYANPVWATTSEIGVSGGSVTCYLKEAATCWLLPLPKNRNLSGLSQQFAAICRQLPPKFTISPQRLSRKPAAFWRGITFAFLPDVFAQGAHMLNYFRVAGCATARSGELVEFVYIVDARSAISAKAEALNQARNERLSHIQITRVREVAA